MAPSLSSRRLKCFYCGNKSPTRQDGTIREWECRNCEAVNYLDENGEITDPPIAKVAQASNTVHYASQSEWASPSSVDNALFCDACLKNQHLVRSSLAQYVLLDELDTLAVDREYLKFKESVENRYPQVCEDCFQGVVDRLKQSSYTAKTDHLRRLLDKTRKTGTVGKTDKTWLDLLQLTGQVAWTLGISGQITWNLLGVLGHVRQRLLEALTSELSSPDPPQFAMASYINFFTSWLAYRTRGLLYSLDTSSIDYGIYIYELGSWSLLLSFLGFWWNPKFKEGYRGYHRHIQGFSEWYKYQALVLVARVVFWYTMSLEFFKREDRSATLGIQTFMLVFTSVVLAAAQRCIKVDFSPLFAPTSPERLLPFMRRKEKSNNDGQDVSPALTNAQDEPSHSPPSYSASRQIDPFYEETSFRNHQSIRQDFPKRSHTGYDGSRTRSRNRDPRDVLGMPRMGPSLADMTEDESHHYLSTGELPPRMVEVDHNEDPDAMDWKPQETQPQNLKLERAPRQSQLFNQAPVNVNPSPFWYKGLPPAPTGPAHRARNPPNVPRLVTPSKEAKENFFNHLTGQVSGTNQEDHATEKLEIDYPFAQQKFFHPNADRGSADLTEMFEQAFTLKTPVSNKTPGMSQMPPQTIQLGRRYQWRRHVFTIAILIVTWLSWEFAFAHPDMDSKSLPLGVMIVCGVFGLLSLIDFIFKSHSSTNPIIRIGVILSCLQIGGAGYYIREIVAGRAYCGLHTGNNEPCLGPNGAYNGWEAVSEGCEFPGNMVGNVHCDIYRQGIILMGTGFIQETCSALFP